MKPNHQFSFLRNNAVSPDIAILTKLYLPILGREAVTLYLYLLSFGDNGQKQHLFSQILNHLDFGLNILEESFERLSAIKLVDLYQTDEHYLVQLHPTLTTEEFSAIMCTAGSWKRKSAKLLQKPCDQKILVERNWSSLLYRCLVWKLSKQGQCEKPMILTWSISSNGWLRTIFALPMKRRFIRIVCNC